MCTSLLSAWDGETQDIEQTCALAVIAQSPIERLVAYKKERGWRNLKFYSDTSGEFSKDYHANTPESAMTRRSMYSRTATARSVTSGAVKWVSKPPIQDRTRAARPDLMPIWTVLDATPEGRRDDWYPSLEYGK